MFGLQRVGDLCWAAGDMQARGFLLGGTSGRTTLNGEGLQHEDGHSHILAGTIPNCISYDPTFAHEVGVIMHHGLKRMVEKQDNVFYYITLLNENYPMPGLQAGTEEEIIKGMYLFKPGAKLTPRVQLLGSGTILRESLAAQELLEKEWGVSASVWSCPSFNELARDGQDCERWNLLHPTDKARVPFVTQQLDDGHLVEVTDVGDLHFDQRHVPCSPCSLGGARDQAYSGLTRSTFRPYFLIASATLAAGTVPSSLRALRAATTM